MQYLIDTNLLVRISELGHIDHDIARQAVVSLRTDGHDLAIVPQVLYEFWSVATRPTEQNGLGMSVEEGLVAIQDMKSVFRLLRDERAIFERWERIIVDYRVMGKKAHDARIVAAMARHGVSHLLTFNTRDFARYSAITVVAPIDLVSPPAAS